MKRWEAARSPKSSSGEDAAHLVGRVRWLAGLNDFC